MYFLSCEEIKTFIIIIIIIIICGFYVISMKFLAPNRRRLSSRFARSSGSEWGATVLEGYNLQRF